MSGSTVLGGRGGGTIYLKNAGTLHVDGVISANGETGTAASGGGSGGAILMEEIGLIKVYILIKSSNWAQLFKINDVVR